jgi:hypothetical protein
MRMVRAEHRALSFQYIGVQVTGVGEAALGTQHVGDLELQMEGLLVVGSQVFGP